jgi:hypothetical protein
MTANILKDLLIIAAIQTTRKTQSSAETGCRVAEGISLSAEKISAAFASLTGLVDKTTKLKTRWSTASTPSRRSC